MVGLGGTEFRFPLLTGIWHASVRVVLADQEQQIRSRSVRLLRARRVPSPPGGRSIPPGCRERAGRPCASVRELDRRAGAGRFRARHRRPVGGSMGVRPHLWTGRPERVVARRRLLRAADRLAAHDGDRRRGRRGSGRRWYLAAWLFAVAVAENIVAPDTSPSSQLQRRRTKRTDSARYRPVIGRGWRTRSGTFYARTSPPAA